MFSFLRLFLLGFVFVFFAGLGFTYYAWQVVSGTLPADLSRLKEPPSKASRVYSADGELIGEFFTERRIIVPLERIPEHVRLAFISAEDGRFWDHPGFDLAGIARALYTNLKADAPRQGASTITQQLSRLLMQDNKKTLYRKMRELILSLRIERELTKQDILEMYLNRVFLGNGHGVEAAANGYFGKDVADLTLAEGALLAGLVQRPSDYVPTKHLKRARNRQTYVLSRMRSDGHITEAEERAALNEPIALVYETAPLAKVAAPYFVEHVRRWAEAKYGSTNLFGGGLNIFTTLDLRAQKSAEAAVRDGLETIDRAIGFRGPVGVLDEAGLVAFREKPPQPHLPYTERASLGTQVAMLPEVSYLGAVVDIKRGIQVAVGDRVLPLEAKDEIHVRRWRGPPQPGKPVRNIAVGDLIPVRLGEDKKTGETVLILNQTPEIQGALFAMDPHTGRVEAMVGGYDFRISQFNRATQAKRQIGSAMKPFVYAAAMEHGTTQLDIVVDAPVVIHTASGLWSPSNYDGKFLGAVTLRTAMAKSLNTVAVRLIIKTGVEPVIDFMRRVGITSAIPRHVSIALGTPDLTLAEEVGAIAAFSNGGLKIPRQATDPGTPPGRFVDLVTKDDGTIVDDYRQTLPVERVMTPELAYTMLDLMAVVVQRGTGKAAQALGRPIAGKTGTSTGFRDVWFVATTTDRIAGVWVGRDDFTPLADKITGGGAALPIWLQYMQAAHPNTPVKNFDVPANVTLVRANELTGQPLPPGTKGATWVPFLRGTLPSRFGGGDPGRFGPDPVPRVVLPTPSESDEIPIEVPPPPPPSVAN